MELFFEIALALLVLKAFTVGSEFSFHYWIKYGKKYTNWYASRETFDEYLKEVNAEKTVELKNNKED